ncbi:hypothetical protein DKM44_01805 [Deinococcus irradiatisoli]|uniref:Tyr recombinase domain-containing protein n=1 Tax=Deinococcus irradiatisoli TaxID=2202254 RepID=A0A2Z3JJL6_9DEIO|nr:site-specific integrase [Deinococcus irradiatisoli]AWN22128.1 hypothetical protein DKM44_01805 [Deinococcus irradiatisoli]
MTKAKVKQAQGRRGNGEGSITEARKLPNGESVYRYEIRVQLPTGERHRLKGTYQGRGIQSARKAMHEAKAAAEKGAAGQDGPRMTINALLSEWMEQDRKHAGVSHRTLSIQADLIRLHVAPHIGNWTLARLTPTLLDGYYRTLVEETKLERGRQQIHNLLSQAFAFAVRRSYLAANPVREVKVPKRAANRTDEDEGVNAWTPEEAKRLVEAALSEGSMLSYAIVFALRTGMRRGEVFGLRWENVDLEERKLRVVEALATHGTKSRSLTSPKTKKSRRPITLSASALEMLDRVRALQVKHGTVDAEYVFTTRTGQMQHPNNANRLLKRLLRQAGLPDHSFHALRHTFVSIAAHQGVPIQAISVYVGHADPVVTQRVYLHLWPEHQAAIEIEV